MSELELNHDCIGDFRNLALSGLCGTKESDLGFPFAWACAIQWDAYRNAVGLTDGRQGKPILVKRPIQSGARRLEYRVTGTRIIHQREGIPACRVGSPGMADGRFPT